MNFFEVEQEDEAQIVRELVEWALNEMYLNDEIRELQQELDFNKRW